MQEMDGQWIMGFTHYLGTCSSFEAELWGIYDGLLLMLNKGFTRAFIRTDNLEVIQALLKEHDNDFGITVLRRVQRIMQSDGQWQIQYVPRENNLIADYLTNLGLAWNSEFQVLEASPSDVLGFIPKDFPCNNA